LLSHWQLPEKVSIQISDSGSRDIAGTGSSVHASTAFLCIRTRNPAWRLGKRVRGEHLWGEEEGVCLGKEISQGGRRWLVSQIKLGLWKEM
jgi:hypothetical protein